MKPIHLFVPKFRKEEILKEIEVCLDQGWTGLGYKTIEIEKAWCTYTELPNAHFVNSGTAGLHLAFKILKEQRNWKDGDEVISTAFTFVSTNHTILYEKLRPVFADIDEYLCLDPASVESKITSRTRAVCFVGIGGNSGQFKKIKEICEKYKLALILDASHMAGTYIQYDNQWNHIGWGCDVTIFSFQAVKNLPTADSGMVCFRDEKYDEEARKLSWMGIDKDTYLRMVEKGIKKRWAYNVEKVGYKYHGNSIMAAIALTGLKYLDEENKYRNELRMEYDKHLSSNEAITIINMASDCVASSHLYQILISNRDEIIYYLNQNQIYPGVHYLDNRNYPMYQDNTNHLPMTKKASECVISLPMHLNLSKEDVAFVSEKLIENIQ